MRKNCRYILFFFLLGICPGLINAQNWPLHTYYDGKFSVEAPTALIEKVDTIETAVGNIAYHTFFLKGEQSANQLFMITYCDYPVGAMHSDSTELLKDFFNQTIEEATSSVRGKLLYSGEEFYEAFPGRIWRITYLDEKAVIKSKAFLVNRRFYTIQVAGYRQGSLNEEVDRFLNSFTLLSSDQ